VLEALADQLLVALLEDVQRHALVGEQHDPEWKEAELGHARSLLTTVRYNRPPMAGERVKLEVKERERLGSRESRRLRRTGLIPGVLYGRTEPHAISVPERELRRVLTTSAGLHAILDVTLDGQGSTHPSILKEYQRDPIRGTITHVDLQEVRLDQPIIASVVVHLVGEAPGAKEGGVLQQAVREVSVEALPMEIPEHLDLDVSSLAIGDSLRVADLRAQAGVTYLDDPETVIASVTLPTKVEEPEVEEEELEGEELAEGEEAPEGEAEGERPQAESEGEAESTEE
jgi:large subunit ribosomal protein L25